MADSEAELTLVMRARNLASREVERLHKGLGGIPGRAKGAGSALLSLGKAAGIVAGAGLFALVGGLTLATKAAAEERKGIAKMDAALKANVKGWKGNTDAIEATIAKREKLAFSDDDLRSSMTFLVTKTHDVNKALALQQTAMDVARLKGISLTDASALVTKGMDGNAKILKTLGIELPKTATAQERLTAIQKAAAGQAEAYGKTEAGAMEASQIAIGDLVEDIGSAFLPVMAEVARFIVEKVIPTIRDIAAKISDWATKNKPLIDGLKTFAGTVLHNVVTWVGRVIGVIGEFVDNISKNKPIMDGLKTVVGLIAKGFGYVTDAVGFTIDKIAELIDWIVKAIDWLGKLDLHIGSGGSNGNDPVGDFLASLVNNGKAAGGWVGLHGPEVALVGERGPEYVVPNHALGSLGGNQTIVLMIDGKEVAGAVVPAVSKQMYYELTRSSATRAPA